MSLIILIDILLLAVLLLYSRVYFSSPIDATHVTEKKNTAVYLFDIYAQTDDSSSLEDVRVMVFMDGGTPIHPPSSNSVASGPKS
jgi:hypothetical protein